MLRPTLAFCLAAAPVLAQNTGRDLATQFDTAARAFTLPGAEVLGDVNDTAIIALLPGLAGNWAPAGNLFGDWGSFDLEGMVEVCAARPVAPVQTAPRSFDLRSTLPMGDDEPATLSIHHDWMIGNSFDRGVDEADALRLVGNDRFDPSASAAPGLLALPHLRGPVSLFNPSPDILVVVAPAQPPVILDR